MNSIGFLCKMFKILVFIYAYKNKKLFEIVDLLISKKSNTNRIHFIIFDQDNENKKDFYKKYKNLEYHHIFWDDVNGISKYRNIAIDKDFDYFLEIGNLENIQAGWDVELTNYYKNNSFISGDVGIIDFNFIFCDKNRSILLKELYPLKFYGQDTLLFYLMYKNNLNLLKLHKNFYTAKNNNLLNSDYIPYSLTHKYNEKILDIFKDVNFIEYCYNNNIKLNKIKNVKNDIEYSSTVYNLDGNSQKFFNFLKTIRRVSAND